MQLVWAISKLMSFVEQIFNTKFLFPSTAPVHVIALLWVHLSGHASGTIWKAARKAKPILPNYWHHWPWKSEQEWHGNVNDCWASDWSSFVSGCLPLLVPLCLEVSMKFYHTYNFQIDSHWFWMGRNKLAVFKKGSVCYVYQILGQDCCWKEEIDKRWNTKTQASAFSLNHRNIQLLYESTYS